jgi:beta-glucosidase
VTYDLWHGYRLLQHRGEMAAYPFGFGLSYCRFEYSDLRAVLHSDPQQGSSSVALELMVANCGAMAAADVVQVYLEPPGREVERAPRSLVAFARLHLAPAERRHARLSIPLRRLAWFDPDRDGFVLEPGLHRLVVARHADDPGLAVALELQAAFLGP